MKYSFSLSLLIAAVSAQNLTSAAESAAAIPAPGATCVSGTAFCASTQDTNIILRCENGKIQPGNCNDNLGEPAAGALCVSKTPSKASCSAVGQSTAKGPATGTGGVSLSTGGYNSPADGNATLSMTNGPTAAGFTNSGSTGAAPIATGAANTEQWAGAAMAAAILGGVAML